VAAQQSRRAILRWSAHGALASASVLAIAPLSAATALRLPTGPMVLSRRLSRDLHDGEKIIVERSWQIQFERTARHIEIGGQLISANVQAPARLKALADIEQNQRKEGMFPLVLSEAGLLVSGTPTDGRESISLAVNAAQQIIAQSPLSLSHKAQSNQHLMQMQRAAQPLIETMPADLFFPTRQPISDRQTINQTA